MPETTANYHHVPVRSKSGIMEDTIRTITISASDGIKALVGKASPDSSMVVLTVLFPTDKFSMAEAKAWVKKHNLEDIEYGPLLFNELVDEGVLDPSYKVEVEDDDETVELAREDVSEADKERAVKEYGNVTYADPANKKYPIDTEAHIRAAWSYINMPKNQAKYSSGEVAAIKRRIIAAWKKKIDSEGPPGAGDKEAEIPAYVSRISLAEDTPAEDGVTSWIELHRVGNWDHPTYGKLSMTADKIKRIIANFKAGVLGYEPSLDLHHEKSPAQGWIKDLALQDGKLMALVNWTKAGVQNVKDRLYVYVSPEYTEDYADRQSKAHGPALLGAALTNRPFLPGQTPLVMSEDLEREYFADRIALSIGKGKPMDEEIKVQVEEGQQEGRKEVVSLTDYKALEDQVKALENQRLTAEARIAKLEQEAKAGEVDAVVNAALNRGVDAYTINTVRAIIMSLPRDGDATIRLEAESQPVNLYHALVEFMSKVPGIVPTASVTMESQTPPPKATEVDAQEFETVVRRVAGVSA